MPNSAQLWSSSMNVFYGTALQGEKDRGSRSTVHQTLHDYITQQGPVVVFDHITSQSLSEARDKLTHSLGELPADDLERRIFVRDKMIEAIEGDIGAAIFEVSVPSLGTGIELAHAYLRPRMGLSEIPILALYQKDYWPNKLSSMVRGISREKAPMFEVRDYTTLNEAKSHVKQFLSKNHQ